MTVRIERQEAVTTVIIDRPAARNAIDPATAHALAEAFRAFDADPASGTVGQELFAYVPSAVYYKLSRLTGQNYGHRYYVDGTPAVADVFVNGQWRTSSSARSALVDRACSPST